MGYDIMKGRIHSVESFSRVDGPGIRYVVFMQGCNLRCKFCHNPDTWNKTDGQEIEAKDLAYDIIKAKPYMKHSGGGVTITGGEPLLQIDFLIELCSILKKHKIHITIDTAGNIDIDTPRLDELIDLVDLFLFDIKHIDDEEHKDLIGVSNQKILKLADYLSNVKNKDMWITIVYVPSITDKNQAFKRYKEYISTLKSVKRVHVLPYHEMGKYKWEKLGLEYKLKDIRIPSENECKKIEEFFRS